MPTSASNSGREQKISLPTCLPSNRRSWRHEEAHHRLKHNSRVFTLDGQKQQASAWKKDLTLQEPTWGIDVPSCRIWGHSPTFGPLMLFFFQESTTRSYSLMNLSQSSMRGAEMWHIWKQHHVIECFWKIMKSIFHIRSMQLQGDGLY